MFNNPKRQLYTSLLSMTSDYNEYPQKTLSGLGKSTKRGIKKCANCGMYNGTRSSVCKNKKCARVLKTSEDKSKANLEAVQLFTNTTEKQVYSVKVWDMGPAYRGFVQLPLQLEKDSNFYSKVALCFVDSCQNSFDNSILKCHEEEENLKDNTLCSHIKAALKSQNKAHPLQLDPNILKTLTQNIKDEISNNLCLYNADKEGPLVQKVSKSVMAVKCKVSAKHPLGYLHFTFIKGKGRETYENFFCSCSEFSVSAVSDDGLLINERKCLHYYACIWALSSNKHHSQEFSSILGSELSTKESTTNISNKSVLQIMEATASSCKNLILPTSVKTKSRILKKIVKKSKLRRNKETIKRCHKILPNILPIEIKVLEDSPKLNNTVSWEFMDWLSFLTESINSTMQFENYGIINTMVLQVPEEFYKCLAKRIPPVYEVLQNGNCIVSYIMNILHLKEIFDTPKIKLKISKKFIHHDQKGYIEFNENEDNNESSYQCPFIYFLNVGQSTVDESDNTNNSFYIEWSPSLFTVSNVGQLRLQYKYGRKST